MDNDVDDEDDAKSFVVPVVVFETTNPTDTFAYDVNNTIDNTI